MKQTEFDKFRKVLETRVIELDRSARRREVICIEEAADPVDRRLRANEREFAVQNLEAESTRLQEARAALQRIQDGTYGACVECEEAISPVRLAALPWAAFCIQCQEALDCRCGAKHARPALAMAA